MAVAIDGEIFQDAYLVQLKPESEIVLIPKIGGGCGVHSSGSPAARIPGKYTVSHRSRSAGV
jgi:hypothetical protein